MAPREMPDLGLGTALNDDPDECAATVEMALEMGYRMVDTAQMYDNEAYVGRGLERADVDREDVFLATKIAPENNRYQDVLDSTRESLDRLGVDSVELLYLHWPTETYDPDDSLRAFDELYDEGTIDHVGLSNFTPELLDEARAVLDAPVFAHQVEMHPLLQQEELVAYARRHDHYLVAYSPLAKGAVLDDPDIGEIATQYDITPAQLSLAWLASKENVVPIPKSTDERHLRDNLDAVSLDLDESAIAAVDALEKHERILEPDYAAWK